MVEGKSGAELAKTTNLLTYGGAEGLADEMRRRRFMVKDVYSYFSDPEKAREAVKKRWEGEKD